MKHKTPTPLSQEQRKTIRSLATGQYTIPEIAKKSGTYYSVVYSMVMTEGLPVKINTVRAYRRTGTFIDKSIFNPYDKKSWLL